MSSYSIISRRAVWAAAYAVATANAGFRVLDDNAIWSYAVRACGASRKTGRIIAVVAGQGQEGAASMRIYAVCQRINLAPDYKRLKAIEVFAGHAAAAAANAFIHIN